MYRNHEVFLREYIDILVPSGNSLVALPAAIKRSGIDVAKERVKDTLYVDHFRSSLVCERKMC